MSEICRHSATFKKGIRFLPMLEILQMKQRAALAKDNFLVEKQRN